MTPEFTISFPGQDMILVTFQHPMSNHERNAIASDVMHAVNDFFEPQETPTP